MEYVNPTCGCQLHINGSIKYCSKHNATEDMYEALKKIRSVWPGLDPDIKFPHLEEVIQQALAKADKR